MADGTQTQERIPENLRKQLAVAVKSIRWSYAIFWSPSTTQQGVLEWGDGYYNGEIKTRKTVPAMEIKADQMFLQRSGQLRELYESLLEGEADQQSQRSSAVLSPEDLTDAEWYYLVCMSFVFNPGQGLPGRALANGCPIWLCNAHHADSKVFSRSLLAKSASIQTVVCFPYLDGAIELGVTEKVLEDPRIIQHIKTSLLEFSKPDCMDKSSSPFCNMDDDTHCFPAKIDHEIVDTIALGNFYSQTEVMGLDQEGINVEGSIHEDFTMGSPDDCSIGCEHNHQAEGSMPESINGGASQVQSWHFMDNEFGKCIQGSMNSSDCISQVFVSQGKVFSPLKGGNAENIHLKELEECSHTKLNSLDIGNYDDMHYRRILSIFCRKSELSIENPCFQASNRRSSFMCWKKRGLLDGQRHRELQVMLKKILFDVPLMHGGWSLTSQKEDGGEARLSNPESHEISAQHASAEKVMENEKFLVLKSMVPSVSKVSHVYKQIDEASVLGETIEYLKDLEARVEELESCIDSTKYDQRSRRYPDMVEQTSDNYENRKIDYCKRAWINKRKACDTDETNPEFNSVVRKDGPVYNMEVRIQEQEVLIEIRCPWREYLLLDIIDAMNTLNLDAHSVQSSNANGILTLSLQSKFRGAAVASARMIQQTLIRVAG